MCTRIAMILLVCSAINSAAQQSLMFGTVKAGGHTQQGRFEVSRDGSIKSIVFAPYGITPVTFEDVKQQKSQLSFSWPRDQQTYHCVLTRKDSASYVGDCNCKNEQPIELTIREFTKEDAEMQGNFLRASAKEIQIIDRALSLLNNGSNWNRLDTRVCDIPSYPYKWSLFCALHQASIDIDSEYRHIRPANQATRQAIGELTAGKKYAHLLQDYNNEAQSFEAISKALIRARDILAEKIKLGQ